MKEETIETIGQLKDQVDSLLCATGLSMPAEFHLNCLKDELKEISETLKRVYIAETGEDPWE